MTTAVITWHAIGHGPAPLFCAPDEFERQLDAIVALGATVQPFSAMATPSETLRVMLTFDDGYGSFASEAWPRLRERGMPATVFLISGRSGSDNRWPGQPADVPIQALMGWETAARLAAEGCEVGAHGVRHIPLTLLDRGAVDEEMAQSKRTIEERCATRVTTFAYPYGDVNDEVAALAGKHFQAAAGTVMGLAGEGSDRFHIPRIDACYLNAARIARIGSVRFQLWVAARSAARRVRRLARADWNRDDFDRP